MFEQSGTLTSARSRQTYNMFFGSTWKLRGPILKSNRLLCSMKKLLCYFVITCFSIKFLFAFFDMFTKFVCLSLLAVQSFGAVVHLTESTFAQTIDGSKNALVEFYAPW